MAAKRTKDESLAVKASLRLWRYHADAAGHPAEASGGRPKGQGAGKTPEPKDEASNASDPAREAALWPSMSRPANKVEAHAFFLKVRDRMREYVNNLPKDMQVGGYWSAATDYVNRATGQGD